MKTHISIPRVLTLSATILLAGLVHSSLAVTEATTPPVGFVTVTINGAASGLDGNTAISVPLYNTPDFQGAVASIQDPATFTLTGATWTAGVYAMPTDGGTATTPRLARIKSGAQVGKFFRVTANTTNQLTVDLTLYGITNISSVLAAGDTVELVPANTIGSVFGTPPTLAGGGTVATSDNILLQNGAGWLTYFWRTNLTPNRWVSTGTLDRASSIIYPDTGVYVLRRVAGDLPLTLSGTVPTTTEQSDIENPSFLSNRFPTDTTLGGLNLQNLPGWVKNTTANTSDNVYILQPSGAWNRYFFHSTANQWRLTGTTPRDTTPIPAGTAVYISYAAGTTPATFTQVLPYTP